MSKIDSFRSAYTLQILKHISFLCKALHLLFPSSENVLSPPFSIPDFTSQHLPAIRFQIKHHLFKDILSDFNLDPPVGCSYYSDIPSSEHLTTFYVSICVVIWLIPSFLPPGSSNSFQVWFCLPSYPCGA